MILILDFFGISFRQELRELTLQIIYYLFIHTLTYLIWRSNMIERRQKFFSFADYNANELKYGKTMGNQNALHTPSLYADHLFLLLCEYIAQIFIFSPWEMRRRLFELTTRFKMQMSAVVGCDGE